MCNLFSKRLGLEKLSIAEAELTDEEYQKYMAESEE